MLSPLDNRYAKQTRPITNYFSYEKWIQYRVHTELLYFTHLVEIPSLNINIDIDAAKLREFTTLDADTDEIIAIEKETHHDIKAIELYLRQEYIRLEIGDAKYMEFIHFGLTSQDINSVAFSLQLRDCIEECILPKYREVVFLLRQKSAEWSNVSIMALTHGQPAIPTTLGKEFGVFVERMDYCLRKLDGFAYHTKIGGAVGTLAAHYQTYPDVNWRESMDKFCENINLVRWQTTTQITNYEDIIDVSHILIMLNNILVDLCQDIWLYISNDIFILGKESAGQVGSSTMPQKVNPIDFENAEGNLKIANSGFNMVVFKLPISRLQRDLTDSTVLRNYGVHFGHTLLSLINIIRGIHKLKPNLPKIQAQLDSHPEIMAENVQCILRKHGIPDGYELMRNLTQTRQFSDLNQFKIEIIAALCDTINTDIKSEIMGLAA